MAKPRKRVFAEKPGSSSAATAGYESATLIVYSPFASNPFPGRKFRGKPYLDGT
jgi:hypothetical protein